MTEARVIKATFADWRTVKTRKVLQLIFELPIEQTEHVLTRLGAPMPDREKWVAVALLDELVASETEHQQKAKDLNRSHAGKERYANSDAMEQARTRAVLLAKDPQFQMWTNCRSEEHAAAFIRRVIGSKSRSEIAVDGDVYERYLQMEAQFAVVTGQLAEVRG